MSVHFEEIHRVAWLQFLDSDAGKVGLAFLREAKRPAVRATGAPHEMQFDLGRQMGFDDALNDVEALSRLPAKKERMTADRPSLHHTRRE